MPFQELLQQWRKWLVLYLGIAAIGAIAFFGGGFFPPDWFSGWHWWQRLALILLGSPALIFAYVLCEGILEGGVRALLYVLKEHPLGAITSVAVLSTVIYMVVGLVRG